MSCHVGIDMRTGLNLFASCFLNIPYSDRAMNMMASLCCVCELLNGVATRLRPKWKSAQGGQ